MAGKTTTSSFVLFLLISIGTYALGQDLSSVEVKTIPLRNNLYLLANSGSNIMLSAGEDGPLVIDTGIAEMSKKVATAISATGSGPARMVINTHWHFDHVGGNQLLAESGAIFIAHRNVRRTMINGGNLAVIDREVAPSPTSALPDITFDKHLTVHFNGEEFQLTHVPSAHTNGDCIVYLPNSNVLHMGDTFFNGMYPFFDTNAGGALDGIIKAFDVGMELANEQTIVIPGHGRLSNKKEMKEYRNMLSTVRDRVQKLVAEGKSLQEITDDKPTADFDKRWGNSWLTPDMWVELIYRGMKGTDKEIPVPEKLEKPDSK